LKQNYYIFEQINHTIKMDEISKKQILLQKQEVSLCDRIEELIKTDRQFFDETGDHLWIAESVNLRFPNKSFDKNSAFITDENSEQILKGAKIRKYEPLCESRDETREAINRYVMPHMKREIFAELCERYPRTEWADYFPTFGVYSILFNENPDSIVDLE